jgi:glycosyltransferase involved in cell wall biosynthesis
VRLLLAASDYLVLYSGYEGLSHTILEALQVGTPVIVSNRGGNPEAVTPGVHGFLVSHPDRGALVETLRRALEDGTRDRLAATARTGLDRFAAGPAAETIVDALEALAEAGR